MDKLQRRQRKTCLNPNWCIMCHSHCETNDHLLVNCRAASFLWKILQVKTGFHHSFNDLKAVVTSIMHLNRATRKNIINTIASVAILWTIWTERNGRIFTNKQSSLVYLWEDSCNFIGQWCSCLHLFKDYSSSALALNFPAFL